MTARPLIAGAGRTSRCAGALFGVLLEHLDHKAPGGARRGEEPGILPDDLTLDLIDRRHPVAQVEREPAGLGVPMEPRRVTRHQPRPLLDRDHLAAEAALVESGDELA